MAEILFLFNMCLCVRARTQRTGKSDQFKMVKATDFKFDMQDSRDSLDMTPYKFFRERAWTGLHGPRIFLALNANSSKMVKERGSP